MNKSTENFIEICIYEVKPDKTGEFEQLLEHFFKDFRRCLVSIPKIFLGERIE